MLTYAISYNNSPDQNCIRFYLSLLSVPVGYPVSWNSGSIKYVLKRNQIILFGIRIPIFFMNYRISWTGFSGTSLLRVPHIVKRVYTKTELFPSISYQFLHICLISLFWCVLLITHISWSSLHAPSTLSSGSTSSLRVGYTKEGLFRTRQW